MATEKGKEQMKIRLDRFTSIIKKKRNNDFENELKEIKDLFKSQKDFSPEEFYERLLTRLEISYNDGSLKKWFWIDLVNIADGIFMNEKEETITNEDNEKFVKRLYEIINEMAESDYKQNETGINDPDYVSPKQQYEVFLHDFQADSDIELIERFNDQVYTQGWTGSRGAYLSAIHTEFNNRKFDFSVIGDSEGLSFKQKIKLEGKIISIMDASAPDEEKI